MYIGLVLILLIIAFLTNGTKSKIVSFISIVIVAPLLIFNRDNPDYYSYTQIFLNPEYYAEGAYSFLIWLIKLFGGNSHEQVLLVMGIFFILTLYRFTKYVKSMNLVLFLYVIFPFVIDVIQIRNTIMVLFVLNAIIEYINENKVRGIIYLILGSMFHNFGIIFIIAFLTIILIKRANYYKMIIVIGLLNFLFMPTIIKLLIQFVPIQRIGDRLLLYLADTNKFQSLLSWGLLLVLDLLIFNIVVKNNNIEENNKRKKLIQLLYNFIFFGLAVYPCLLYLNEFSRFFRSMFIFKYLLLGCVLPYLNRDTKVILIFYVVATSILFSLLHSKSVDYNYTLLHNFLFGL